MSLPLNGLLLTDRAIDTNAQFKRALDDTTNIKK